MKNLKLTKGLSRNEMREIKGGKAAINTCGSRCNSEWGCGQDCPSCDAKWGDSYCS
jgi:hypothetical protein